MTSRRSAAIPLLLLLWMGVAVGQQAPVRDAPARPVVAGTASIAGAVLHDATNQPVRRAVVSLVNADRALRLTVVTNETGRFTFTDLPAGRYSLGANKAGFVSANYGASRPLRPGVPIAIGDGEKKAGLSLRLPPGAVITGTVRGRTGTPIEGARVSVLRLAPSYLTGERQLTPAGLGGFGEATDDRGEYRVFGLPAGEYYVVATMGIGGNRSPTDLRETTASEIEWAARLLQSPGAAAGSAPEPGRAVEYAPVFHPGSPTFAGAGAVVVKAGEERRGVDVLLDLAPTGRIVGRVVSPGGVLPPALQVNVIAHDTIPGIPFSGFGSARVDAEGRFVSAGLTAGEYTVTVRVPPSRGSGPGAAALFGITSVAVTGGDVETTVTLGTGVTVAGHVEFLPGTIKPPEDLSRIRVTLAAERSRTPTLGVPAVPVSPDGTFRLVGVTPGRYRLSAGAVGGWQIKGATLDGRDIHDLPVEVRDTDLGGAVIAFTDRPSEITGDLLDGNGQPAPEYHIVLYPADRAYWVPQSRRIRSARPGADGQFRFQNLPPGEYLIVAVSDVDENEWFDPAFLAQLVDASIKITLTEGEKKVQGLRIKGR